MYRVMSSSLNARGMLTYLALILCLTRSEAKRYQASTNIRLKFDDHDSIESSNESRKESIVGFPKAISKAKNTTSNDGPADGCEGDQQCCMGHVSGEVHFKCKADCTKSTSWHKTGKVTHRTAVQSDCCYDAARMTDGCPWTSSSSRKASGAGVTNTDLLQVQLSLCQSLNGEDTVSNVAAGLDALRKREKMHDGTTVHDQMVRSFGCADLNLKHPKPPPLKAIAATGKSASNAMKTMDGLFRIKEMLTAEYDFWLQGANSHFVSHWEEHEMTSLGKYYALVTSNDDDVEKRGGGVDVLVSPLTRLSRGHRIWVIMRNAFAGISDIKTDKEARIYDIKGSGRECSNDEGCGTDYEFKEKDFQNNLKSLGLFAGYSAFSDDPGHGASFSGGWQTFVNSINDDVMLLKKLKIHDYSLVMRITPTASADCPQGFDKWKWWESAKQWRKAATWKGVGSETCALLDDSRSVRIHAILLDYLQLSTTLANRAASVAPGSKTWSNRYSERFLEFVHTSFYPFFVMELSAKAAFGQHPGDEYLGQTDDYALPDYHYKYCRGANSQNSLFIYQKQCRMGHGDGQMSLLQPPEDEEGFAAADEDEDKFFDAVTGYENQKQSALRVTSV